MSDTARDYQTEDPTATEGLDDLFVGDVGQVQEQVQGQAQEQAHVEIEQVQDQAHGRTQEPDSQNPSLDPKVVPLALAAELLGVHRRYALRLVHKEKISGYQDENGHWLIVESSIVERLHQLGQVQERAHVEIEQVQDQVQEQAHVEIEQVQGQAQEQAHVEIEQIQGQHQEQAHVEIEQIQGQHQEQAHVEIDQVLESPYEDDSPSDIFFEVDNQPSTSPNSLDAFKLLKELEAATYRVGYLQAQLEAERNQVKLLTDQLHKQSWWSRFKAWLHG